MSAPSFPDWLIDLIAEEGESKPIDVGERDALVSALLAAHSPSDIDAQRHRQIRERALGFRTESSATVDEDPLAPASTEERAAAERLAKHFDSDPLVIALRSTQHPHAPRPEIELAARERALEPPRRATALRPRRWAPTAWATMAVAAAAALWLFAKSSGVFYDAQPPRSLAVSRSTDSLFSKPFGLTSNSERIDRIAQVRSRELRENRYAIWGLP